MKIKTDPVVINRTRRATVADWRKTKKTSLKSRAARLRCARDLGLTLSMVTDALTELANRTATT
jgi:PleD family two-component response regulator